MKKLIIILLLGSFGNVQSFAKTFDDFDDRIEQSISSPSFNFGIDMYKDDGNLVVETPAPGMKPENIHIEVNDNILQVHGVLSENMETKDTNYFEKEIERGSFDRSVSLPIQVDASKASATLEDGILTIVLPEGSATHNENVIISIKK